MSTELTSELTHFNLLIRLSNVQQMALLLSTVLKSLAAPVVPGFLAEIPVYQCEAVRNNQKLCLLLQLQLLRCNMTWETRGNKHVLFLQVWSLWFLVR